LGKEEKITEPQKGKKKKEENSVTCPKGNLACRGRGRFMPQGLATEFGGCRARRKGAREKKHQNFPFARVMDKSMWDQRQDIKTLRRGQTAREANLEGGGQNLTLEEKRRGKKRRKQLGHKGVL